MIRYMPAVSYRIYKLVRAVLRVRCHKAELIFSGYLIKLGKQFCKAEIIFLAVRIHVLSEQ